MRVMVRFTAIEVTERDQSPGLVWVPGLVQDLERYMAHDRGRHRELRDGQSRGREEEAEEARGRCRQAQESSETPMAHDRGRHWESRGTAHGDGHAAVGGAKSGSAAAGFGEERGVA